MRENAPTGEEWLEAMATAPLNMAEMDALIRENQALWADRDEKHKAASEALKLAEASDAKLIEALRQAGKKKYHVDGLGTVSVREKTSVRVPGNLSAKAEFLNYLESLGHEVFLSMVSVHSGTLNSWYAEKLEEHLAKMKAENFYEMFKIPGLEEPTVRESIAFHKEKKKGTV